MLPRTGALNDTINQFVNSLTVNKQPKRYHTIVYHDNLMVNNVLSTKKVMISTKINY